MDNQQLFNIAWERAKNPVRAYNEHDDYCTYRHPHDPEMRCFIGAAIPDGEYDPNMERKGFHEVQEDWNLFPNVSSALGGNLQRVHDNEPPEDWLTDLRRIAEAFGLEVPA